MKWGKHLKSHVDSVKREHGLRKTLKNANNMSTKEIQKAANRAQLENDMKRLSKERKVGSRKDKADYRNRANMSDQELQRKVQRLRAKSSLKRNAKDATKNQREIGKKILQIAAPLALQYVLTKSIGKKDVFNAVLNNGGGKAKMVKNVIDAARKAKAKHADSLDDVIMHSFENEEGESDDAVIENLLEDFSDDEIAEMLSHGIGDDDTLQHHGVKGMHWGVHKGKIKAAIKNHVTKVRQKQNKRVLAYHEKNMNKSKTYTRLYKKHAKVYKTHLGAAQKAVQQHLEIKRARVKLGVHAAVLASPMLAKGAKVAANAAHKAATNPDNIRKAKNVVQAMKRSPIRYVDGKKMTNVVKTVYNHGL